jgi:hypothetical protein
VTDQTTTTATISLADFRAGLLVNWDEAFTSTTGIFLDRGTSMFETLATISAEEASRPVGGGCSNIAAQVNHAWFYLDIMNRLGRGEDVPRPIDWDGSWDVGAVDETEWERLVAQLRDAHDEVRIFITIFEGWDERMIGGAFGMLAHCAYHLGEIRAGLCSVKGDRDKGA